ncbi:hypothetical protein OR263_00465 [Streptomyces sp. NEAU-H22]|uniref:hypothetical protein n=2 Tax=unclassified Streptomyces TaxID=2593676 RepID=UPI0022577401|nr:hypothetical protein [Streptomyces sp. NEAU-H22]MCX3285207.1 hypothetical protein [Streptomyces sp. NEAU-H22]
MSRETDTPSSGPNGRGGAAYPSGTPPYGTPTVSDAGTDAGRSATRPEERKTETTLTTRIRINIPGSRPIPPVVVRKPVTEAEGPAETDTHGEASTAPGAAPSVGPGTAESPGEPAQQGDDKPASDWFAPRKSGGGKGGPGSGSTNGAGMSGGSRPAPGGSGAGSPGAGASGGARPGAGRPGGVVGSMGAPGGSRSGGTNGAGLPGGATGGPVAPGHGGGTGSFDVTEALAAGPLGNGSRPAPGGGEPRRDDLPYFSENGSDGQNGQAGYGGQPGGPSASDGFGTPGGPGSPGPAGPTGGPVTGDGPMVSPAGGPGGAGFDEQGGPGGPGGFTAPGGPGAPGGFDGSGSGGFGSEPGGPAGAGAFNTPGGPAGRSGPDGFGDPAGPGAPEAFNDPGGPGAPGVFNAPGRPGGPGAIGGGPGGPGAPGGPAGTRVPGAPGGPAGPGARGGTPAPGPGGGMSDDTAILTPQKPAPEPPDGQGYGPRHDNVSGHTVTSGIPVVPPGAASPFGPGAPGDGPVPHTAPKLPEPVSPPPASSSKAPKKKGRNKLVLLAVGVVVLAGGVYGAGLLMNRTDVPKGTTVLGVDIGGTTRDGAVRKLDEAFDKNAGKELKLSLGGKTVSLDPDNAGLQFDMDATADAAAKSDYNPVSVIASLFGNHRTVTPVMPVDEEKLHASLEAAAGGSGATTDGTIEFKDGKAVPVYGKTGKGVDLAKSTTAVEEAYRTQVETGTAGTVNLPTTTRQPTVSNAEVDRVLKDFAQPAMSAKAIVQTDAAHSIPFGALSLPKILSFKAVDGKLVDTYNLKALQEAYGKTFEGVQIEGASGKRDVLPQDVVAALRKALRGKTPAERIGVIDTKPN